MHNSISIKKFKHLTKKKFYTRKMIYQVLLVVMFIFGLINASGSENLLMNADFMQPLVPSNWLYMRVTQAAGWNGNFEFFNGYQYNNAWPSSVQVCQASNPQSQYVSQVVSNNYDYYSLFFQFALPTFLLTSDLYGQTIDIFWNGNTVERFSVWDSQIHNTTIQLISNMAPNQLRIQSLGIKSLDDGIGFTNFILTGYCKENRNYFKIEQKCKWNPILHCLKIEQTQGNCLQCQLQLVPQSRICKCQNGFYFAQDKCYTCLFPCQNCKDSPRNCLSCPQFYLLQGNQCVIDGIFTQIASSIVSFPGFQFYSFGQIILGYLDQFWPYYYHHREYGKQTNEILTFIHTIQNNKWFLLSLEKQIDFNYQSMNFSRYNHYSNQKFLQKQNKTSYFWDGAFELTFFSFPVALIVFFVLRKLFFLTFNYRISRHLRIFSFFLTIYVLGFEGDLSYLSFLSFMNAKNLFSFKFQDKVGQFLWIIVFFMLILFCFGGVFISKILYKRLSKYFIVDLALKLQSLYVLTFLSTKALVLGAVNAFLATSYEILIIALGAIEILGLFGLTYFQWKFKCYSMKILVHHLALKSILMGTFNLFLWIDWKFRTSRFGQQEQSTKNLLDFNCKVLIIIVNGLGVIQIASAYFFQKKMTTISCQSNDKINIQIKKQQKQNQPTKQRKNQTKKLRNSNQEQIYERTINNNNLENDRKVKVQVIKEFSHKNYIIPNKSINSDRKEKRKHFHIIWEDCNYQNLEVINLKRLNS